MVQAVSRRLLTAVARVRSQASPCEIDGGQSDTDRFLSQFFGFPCQCRSTNARYSSSSTCCFLPGWQMGEGSE